jgi:hypothetical protein
LRASSLGGIIFAIDAGQCAPGARFDGWTCISGVECGGDSQLRTGIVGVPLAGQQKAQREMSLKRLGVGIDGAAVEALGVGEPLLGIGDVARVEQGTGICGILREVEIEAGLGSLPVGFADCGFGVGHLLGSVLWRGGCDRGGSRRRCCLGPFLGASGDGGEEQDQKSDTVQEIPQGSSVKGRTRLHGVHRAAGWTIKRWLGKATESSFLNSA